MLVKNPDAIVRVKNNMTGEESHIIHEASDGQRRYHLPAQGVSEMRWKDYIELTTQYKNARRYLSLHESTLITDEGDVIISGEDVDLLLPLEDIIQMTTLPELAFTKLIAKQSVLNLTRVKEVAEEQERDDLVAIVSSLLEEAEVAKAAEESEDEPTETK